MLYLLVEWALMCRHRLSLGGSEKIQLTALLGAFKVAVELSQKKIT
jgi:replication factor C subunit 3/5